MSKMMEFLTNLNNWYYSISKENATKSANPVRFGVLSAALINPTALFDTARTHPDAVVVAIAARSLEKAQAQCKKYGIPGAHGSYDELLARPDIDAVYIPLPNGLHCEWAIKAMKAGKHVLIEKPIASNADETREILACAQETGKVALEAFHWQFHPAAHVVKALIDSGRYGNVTATSASMLTPAGTVPEDDIRFKYDKLAGGASMDLTYVLSATRYFVGAYDNYEVLEAVPRLNKKDKKIDDAMKTTLLFRAGEDRPDVRSTTHADLAEPKLWGLIPTFWHGMNIHIAIELERATITFVNFPAPHFTHKIIVHNKETGTTHTQKHYSFGPKWGPRSEPWWSTYRYQLEAFVSKVKGEEPKHWIDLEDSIEQMELIDRVYEKAGMDKRGL